MGNARHVQGRQHSRGGGLIRQQVVIDDAVHGDIGVGRGIGHRRQFAPPPDPDVARAVGHRRVKNGDIRFDRGDQHHRVTLVGKGVVDNHPVGAVAQHVGADQPAHREKRRSFLCGYQARVNGGAGGVNHADAPFFDRCVEPGCAPGLAQADGAGFNRTDTARADQLVDLQATGRDTNKVKITQPARDHRAGKGHRNTGIINGHGNAHSVLKPVNHSVYCCQHFIAPVIPRLLFHIVEH